MSPLARRIAVTLATLVVAAATARLGWWQLDRAAQKTALQAQLDARATLPALDAAALAVTPTQAEQQHQRAARLVGRWSDGHTVFLDNRQQHGSQPGFIVVTPLRLADGRAVLVQRGWAPRDAADRTRLPALPAASGEVVIDGRIAPPPARLFEFSATESGRIRQNLDLDAFARETGLRLAPVTVQQTEPAAGADGLRRDWPAPATGVAKHHGYAFQWFGLSALVLILYVWFQLIQPYRRRG